LCFQKTIEPNDRRKILESAESLAKLGVIASGSRGNPG
jgi:hypothetical protein